MLGDGVVAFGQDGAGREKLRGAGLRRFQEPDGLFVALFGQVELERHRGVDDQRTASLLAHRRRSSFVNASLIACVAVFANDLGRVRELAVGGYLARSLSANSRARRVAPLMSWGRGWRLGLERGLFVGHVLSPSILNGGRLVGSIIH